MKTVVRQWGNSLAVRIPKPLADQIRLRQGTDVDLVASNGSVIVRPSQSRRRLRLRDLLKQVNRKNLHAEIQTGPKRGREAW